MDIPCSIELRCKGTAAKFHKRFIHMNISLSQMSNVSSLLEYAAMARKRRYSYQHFMKARKTQFGKNDDDIIALRKNLKSQNSCFSLSDTDSPRLFRGWISFFVFSPWQCIQASLIRCSSGLTKTLNFILRFLAMAVYSSKLDTLLIWLNENVLQGNNLRGSYLRHPLVKKTQKSFAKISYISYTRRGNL